MVHTSLVLRVLRKPAGQHAHRQTAARKAVVCMGRYWNITAMAAWVMTFDSSCDCV
jgi:hypothetical protein